MNTYKAELKNSGETRTVIVEAATAGGILHKLCLRKELDGSEIVNCYKGDHRSGSIYYDELVGMGVVFQRESKRLTISASDQFSFCEQVDAECKLKSK